MKRKKLWTSLVCLCTALSLTPSAVFATENDEGSATAAHVTTATQLREAMKKGGNITLEADILYQGVMYKVENSKVDLNLNGHQILFASKPKDGVISVLNSEMTIRNGKIRSYNGTVMYVNGANGKSTLNIESDAEIQSDNGISVYIVGSSTLNTSGNLHSHGVYATVQGHGLSSGNLVVNITGGRIENSAWVDKNKVKTDITKGDIAVYIPQAGNEINISGGTVVGGTAVYQKNGTLNITGGLLGGKAEAKDYAYNGSGANVTGDAVVIDNCDYPGEAPTVSIRGGSIISDYASAVASYAKGDLKPVDKVISGGAFRSKYAPANDLLAEGFDEFVSTKQNVYVPHAHEELSGELHFDKDDVKKGHWHICDEDDKEFAQEDHNLIEGEILQAPTTSAPGRQEFKCECGYTEVKEIDKLPEHVHATATGEWSSDENEHWHVCDEDSERFDIKAHIFGDLKVDKEPTETEQGSGYRECECGYRVDVEIPVKDPSHNHVASDQWSSDKDNHWHECAGNDGEKLDVEAHNLKWIKVKDATTTETGLEAYKCTVCDYIAETKEIGMLTPPHVHIPSDLWGMDETSHWHDCVDGDGRVNQEAHNLHWIIDRNATNTEKGFMHEECDICGYTGKTVEIEKLPATPTVKPDTDKKSDPVKVEVHKENAIKNTANGNNSAFASVVTMFAIGFAVYYELNKRKVNE